MENPTGQQPNSVMPTPQLPETKWFIKYKTAIIIFVLVVIVAAVGLFYWMQQPKAPAEQDTNSQGQQENPATKDWTTFDNDQYGFSFQYPKEWNEPKHIFQENGALMSINLSCAETNSDTEAKCPLTIHVAKPGDRDVFLKQSYLFKPSSDYSNGEITRSTVNGFDTASFNIISGERAVAHYNVIFTDNYFYLVKNDGLIYQNNQVLVDIVSSFKLKSLPIFSSVSITGSLKKIDDLKLFKPVRISESNSYTLPTVYYEAGVIQTGKYKNLKRVIAVTEPEGPGAPIISTYATADYMTFVLDIRNEYLRDAFYQKDTHYLNLDYSKITAADLLPTNHPYFISGFSDSYTIANSTTFLGVDSYNVSDLPERAVPLESKDPNLKLFAEPVNFTVWENATEQEKQYINRKNEYLDTSDPILVQDNTGLIYRYGVYDKLALNRGLGDFYSAATIKADFVGSPQMYDEYQYLFPDDCGIAPRYSLKNVSSNDLVFLAKHKLGSDYYRLKDQNHPLYQAQYFNKVSRFTAEEFKMFNDEGMVAPTYEEFVKNNPLLISKDPWGRYSAIGEDEYYIPGGCGKPVIYLYPPKTTEVSVKFTDPIKLTKDIPTYANGWKVLANPDGNLADLQPQYTNCNAINDNVFGSEYAKEACLSNSYPYLYWAGFTTNKYPVQTSGWVVAQKDLETFMRSKLAFMGLNAKEIGDMVEYWVPKMLAKQAPYYRVSFLQTKELNQLFPMEVNPAPDSVIRVFLDWEDLASKPSQPLLPQKLVPVSRDGFTYVEWGGLNR